MHRPCLALFVAFALGVLAGIAFEAEPASAVLGGLRVGLSVGLRPLPTTVRFGAAGAGCRLRVCANPNRGGGAARASRRAFGHRGGSSVG